jgi:hypothetical protein
MAHHHGGSSPEELAEVLVDPYDKAEKYARASIYFISAWIGVFALNRLAKRCKIYRSVGKAKVWRS